MSRSISQWWASSRSPSLPTSTQDVQANSSQNDGDEQATIPLLRADAKVWNNKKLAASCTGVCVIAILVVFFRLTLSSKVYGAEVAPLGSTSANKDRLVFINPKDGDANRDPYARNTTIKEVVLKDAGGTGNNGYMAVVTNALPSFHVEGSCTSVAKTSTIARNANCLYAVNGGPFQSFWHGGCIGPTVMDNQVVNDDWNTSYASLGVTKDGLWVVGHIPPKSSDRKFELAQVVTGFGRLVLGGEVVVPEGGALAGRTAVGITNLGELLMMQVDGCERCWLSGGPSGLTVHGMAQLMVDHGAVEAINLDGGGSSTTVSNGQVKNRPDCTEFGFNCERPVTSVVCVNNAVPDVPKRGTATGYTWDRVNNAGRLHGDSLHGLH